MAIDFKAKPFNLSDSDIKWVEETFNSLSVDEKIGQIFVDMLWGDSEEQLKEKIGKYHQGGFRYNNESKEDLYKQNETIQAASKVPALIAANVEGGGNGAVKGGTLVGNPVAIGATQNKENAYYLGYHGCKEAAAVGCNWTFAPIVDVNYNWRNCVVSDRCFSSDPEVVLEMAKEYHRGAKDAGVACCMKHFPGDGLDERDQHIVTTVNDQTVEEWDASFGKIYKGLIDQGMESIMIGHIQLPEYSRKLRPGIKDQDIMPATMAPELLKDLLRDQLGFNGLVITDATHMVGLTSKAKRSEFVPGVIEAGCDMILYYRDKEEDINFFKTGLETGLVSQERFDEAVKRVLAMKAMLKLHEKAANGTIMPPKENLEVIGCEEHIKKANEIIDESITLVKNTRDQLPLTPEKHKRIMLYSIDSSKSDFRGKSLGGTESVEDMLKAELEAAGFEVSTFEINSNLNGKQLLASTPVTEYVAKYDAVMLVCNVSGFSQSNERRLHWSMPMGPDIPWYVTELPTVCISLANPFHLIDVPMVPTYINTYNVTKDAIRQVVEKITGKSEFKGVSPVDAFCGAWDTRI